MFQLDCAIHVPNLPFKFPKKLGIKKEKVQHFFSFFPKMQKAKVKNEDSHSGIPMKSCWKNGVKR